MNYFYDYAAVVNEDKTALRNDVKLLKKKYGKWFKIRGFSEYKQFFLAVHIAKLNHHPFTVVFLKDDEPIGELILKKADPMIATYKYMSTKQLEANLPVLR